MTRHISDLVRQALQADAWRDQGFAAGYYEKRIERHAPAGQFSNGARVVALRLDMSGRWLERLNAWGEVESCVDLRDFAGRPLEAIAAALA